MHAPTTPPTTSLPGPSEPPGRASPAAGSDAGARAAPAPEPRASRSSQTDLFGLRPRPAQPSVRGRVPPGPIRVGTSGYSFADWVGPFYPPGTPRSGMLDFYKTCFNTVEINATYYRIPPPATMERMAARTPADFRFMVKLPAAATHHRDRDPQPLAAFWRAVAPLAAAGKYAGALAQFPYSFKHSRQARAYLAWLCAALPEARLFIEFRHASWDLPELAGLLGGLGAGFCAVDEPALPGLFPRRVLHAGDVGYVRLHGRNARDWWSGGARRYDYLYSREELQPWAARIREMAAAAAQTYVFFNNCHAGQAVLNARMMEELLGLDPLPPPER